MLFRLDNRVTDAVHDVFRTVFGRSQGVESRPFPLEGVSEAFVYAVHFFTEIFYFIKKIMQAIDLAVDFFSQAVKSLYVLFGCVTGKPFTESRGVKPEISP